MDNKKLGSMKRRIVAANNSFGVMGSMILTYDIDAMTPSEQVDLYEYLLAKGITFKYLTGKVEKIRSDLIDKPVEINSIN